MNLRLRSRQANEDYAQSPNFGRGSQAKTVTGLSAHRNDNLTSQVEQDGKKVPANVDRKPGEQDFEYAFRLTRMGFSNPEAAIEAAPAPPEPVSDIMRMAQGLFANGRPAGQPSRFDAVADLRAARSPSDIAALRAAGLGDQ